MNYPTTNVEVRGAQTDAMGSTFITSIVDGWKEDTFLLGAGLSHIDIISAGLLGQPEARIAILHPLKERDLTTINRDTLKELHSALSIIQNIIESLERHQYQAGITERYARRESMNAIMSAENQEYPAKNLTTTLYVSHYHDRNRFDGINQRAFITVPSNFRKPRHRELPEPLVTNRCWLVINGPRAGIWLCEDCEKTSAECKCPLALFDHPRHRWRIYVDGKSAVTSIVPSRFTEIMLYEAWREGFGEWNRNAGKHEPLIRHKFGRNAVDDEGALALSKKEFERYRAEREKEREEAWKDKEKIEMDMKKKAKQRRQELRKEDFWYISAIHSAV